MEPLPLSVLGAKLAWLKRRGEIFVIRFYFRLVAFNRNGLESVVTIWIGAGIESELNFIETTHSFHNQLQSRRLGPFYNNGFQSVVTYLKSPHRVP
jgi:hypothetical protein